jgi:methylglutaconyl-CoA hydratase
MMTDLVRIERDQDVARVTLNRPELNNALNRALIEELRGRSKALPPIAPSQRWCWPAKAKPLCGCRHQCDARSGHFHTRREHC